MRAPVMALPASAALGALAFALVTGHGVPEDIAEALDGHAKAEALRAGLIAGAEAQVRSPESAVIVAGKAPLPPPPPPAIITLLREDGATAELIGATPGLTGYRVTRGADNVGYTLYVTPSGHAVVGVLYAPDGLLITAEQIAAAEKGEAPTWPDIPAPAAPPEASPAAIAAVSEDRHRPPEEQAAADLPGTGEAFATADVARPPATTGFTLGTAGPSIAIFADPRCPYSRSTVALFAQAALEGELTLTVIPVALLGADSAYQALAAVGEDGAAAWFSRQAADPTPASAATVRENNAAHAATGLGVVPVVRTLGADGTWHDHAGGVTDVAGFLEGSR